MRAAPFIVFVAVFLLAACAPPAASSGTTDSNGSSSAAESEDTVRACAKRGGELRRVCLRGETACVVNHPDGGKTCTDKAQCTGQCRFEGKKIPPWGTSAVGACQRTSDPCGCFTEVVDGKIQGMMCVD